MAALLLSGCAAAPPKPPASAWVPDEDWWAGAGVSGGTFVAADGSVKRVRALHAANLYEVSRKIREQSAIDASVALADSDALNAFADETGGRRLVTLTLALLEAIGDDRDALATTIGHEVAHLYYAHGDARKGRNHPAQGVTYVLGTIAGVGGVSSGGTAGVLAVNTMFSRYEEREADIKGMEWAVAAGFSPCGSARTMRMLAHNEDATGENQFLSTHPGHEERIARANAMSRQLSGRKC